MLINNRLEDPYNKMPNEGPLPILSKTLIKSKLSKKFWIKIQYIYESNSSPDRNIPPQEKKIKSPNIKTKKSDKNNININSGNISNNNIKNNINNIKLKKRKVKTPIMKQRNLRYMDICQKDNNNNFDKEDNLRNIKSSYKNELDILRDTAINLENELNENEKIIELQKEENILLKNKIQKLTAMLNSIISTDKK
jgi:hypothetical protein